MNDNDQKKGVDVILPAGGRIAGEFAREAGAAIKALIRLNGETLLARTITSLRETGPRAAHRGRGHGRRPGPASRRRDAGAALLPEGETGPDNIFRALKHLRGDKGDDPNRPVLIVTTDLPFVTAPALTGFLDRCPSDADLCIPRDRAGRVRNALSRSENEFVRLADGQWTIGLRVPRAARCAGKKPDAAGPRVCRAQVTIGDGAAARRAFIARFAFRQLSVVHIEQRCSQILGVRGVAVHGCAPELAFDIDQESEHRYAVEWASAAPAPQKVNLLP
jgi:hypothetical protein